MTAFRIRIDLGGTKIEAAALDRGGALRLRRRTATPAGDYAGTIAAVAGLVAGIEREIGARTSVGIGIPGTIVAATGLVKNANSTWLIGRPLADDVEAALGRPVRFANDANCFALSEAIDGAGAGHGTVFGVILGTGVGGGIAIGGRILVGANAIAGEWGHNPLPAPRLDELADEWPGPPCYCGRSGGAASRPSCRGRGSPPITGDTAAVPWTPRKSPPALRVATRPAGRRSTAMPSGSPAPLPGSSTSSIRT